MNPLSYCSIVLLAGVLGSGCGISWDSKNTKPDATASWEAAAPDASSGDAGDAMRAERCVLGQGKLPCKLGR